MPRACLPASAPAGEAAAACAKVLVNGGTMVTYGAMSQQVGSERRWVVAWARWKQQSHVAAGAGSRRHGWPR